MNRPIIILAVSLVLLSLSATLGCSKSDHHGAAPTGTTNPGSTADATPEAIVTTPTKTQAGTVSIAYTLKDAEEDP